MYITCIYNVFSMYCRCIFNVFECFFNVFSIFFNVFSMYFQCIFNVFVFNFNVLGVKYFGMVKYFFRLNYTNGVQSVPICAVQWIDFNIETDSINCIIGRIPMSS